jgi:hypothetical protein
MIVDDCFSVVFLELTEQRRNWRKLPPAPEALTVVRGCQMTRTRIPSASATLSAWAFRMTLASDLGRC